MDSQTIIDLIEDAIVIADDRLLVKHCNKPAAVLTKQLLLRAVRPGDDLREMLDEIHGLAGKTAMLDAIIEHKAQRSFAKALAPGGQVRHFEITYCPMGSGQRSELMVVIRDITSQKEFEQRLSTQAANISNLLEKASAIIIGLDTRGYVVEWNQFSTQTLGVTKEEIYTRKFVPRLVLREQQFRFSRTLVRVLTNRETVNQQVILRPRTDAAFNVLISMSPRVAPTGEVVGATLIGQDITELTEYRKSLEHQVEMRTRELQASIDKEKEVVEMKNRFVSIASHEFRSPLSAIRHMAMALQARVGQRDQKSVSSLREIQKHAERMTYLLDDVLTYSKSEPGKIRLKTSVILVSEFISKITEEVRLATQQTHQITVDISQAPQQIQVDEKLLRNVLINLLTNAIKYSPGQREVQLHLAMQDNSLVLEVIDEGIGIAAEDIPFIFEPFNRSRNADAIPGTGLGLSIVKRAVDLLGGTIRVESQLNRGTTVVVRFPLTV